MAKLRVGRQRDSHAHGQSRKEQAQPEPFSQNNTFPDQRRRSPFLRFCCGIPVPNLTFYTNIDPTRSCCRSFRSLPTSAFGHRSFQGSDHPSQLQWPLRQVMDLNPAILSLRTTHNSYANIPRMTLVTPTTVGMPAVSRSPVLVSTTNHIPHPVSKTDIRTLHTASRPGSVRDAVRDESCRTLFLS